MARHHLAGLGVAALGGAALIVQMCLPYFSHGNVRLTISPDDSGGVSVHVRYESGGTGFHWFKTEAEARAWVAKQRAEMPDLTDRHEVRNWPI